MHETPDNASVGRKAVAFSHPSRETIAVVGKDRQRWLNGLLTCDMGRVALGRGGYGLLLTRQGKIQTDVAVVATEDAILLGVALGRGDGVRGFLEGFLGMDDVELSGASERYEWITLHGRAAVEHGARVARNLGWTHSELDWAGLRGSVLVVSRGAAARALELLAQEGAGTIRVGCSADWARLRVELAVPEFGADYDEQDTPHDASLEHRAVSWTKGCYLGQEVVCMQGMRGKVKRRVVRLAIEGERQPVPGDQLVEIGGNGLAVGTVTTVAEGGGAGVVAALGRVAARWSEPDARLSAQGYIARVLRVPEEQSERDG